MFVHKHYQAGRGSTPVCGKLTAPAWVLQLLEAPELVEVQGKSWSGGFGTLGSNSPQEKQLMGRVLGCPGDGSRFPPAWLWPWTWVACSRWPCSSRAGPADPQGCLPTSAPRDPGQCRKKGHPADSLCGQPPAPTSSTFTFLARASAWGAEGDSFSYSLQALKGAEVRWGAGRVERARAAPTAVGAERV